MRLHARPFLVEGHEGLDVAGDESGRGELPKDTDATVLVAMLTGALFYRRWFSREPLSDAFAKQVVWRVLRGN